MRKRVSEMEELVSVHFPSSLVQVTGEGKEVAVLGLERVKRLLFLVWRLQFNWISLPKTHITSFPHQAALMSDDKPKVPACAMPHHPHSARGVYSHIYSHHTWSSPAEDHHQRQ